MITRNSIPIFERISAPSVAADGRTVFVTIETDTAAPINLGLPVAEIGSMVEFLISLANQVDPDDLQHRQSAAAIPLVGIGLAPGRSADETLLIVRLAGCDLAFPLASRQIAALGHDFARTAQVLAANGPPN